MGRRICKTFFLYSFLLLHSMLSTSLASAAETRRNRGSGRNNYCHRNPKLAEGALKYPYGVAHVISSVYHDGLLSHHYQDLKEDNMDDGIAIPSNSVSHKDGHQCHLILLSFWESSDVTDDWMENFIHKMKLVQQGPILLLQLSLSNPPSNVTLHYMRRKLTSLYTGRAQACYFFVILVPQSKQLQTPILQQSVPQQIYDLFRTSLGDAWFRKSYFLVVNLMSPSILGLEGWQTFKNKLELICVQKEDYKEAHQVKIRLILQTVCSSCNDPLTTVLLQGIDPYTGQVQHYSTELFPNFIKRGFATVWLERSLRFQMPASVEITKKSLEHSLPKYLLYKEMQKVFHFTPISIVNAWVNGRDRYGLRDYVDEMENAGIFALGHHFSPLETKSTKIGFTFPYMENRLGILSKKSKTLSKWQILFEEVKSNLIPIAVPSICFASLIMAFRTLGSHPHYHHPRSRRSGIISKQLSFLSILLDWIVYLISIFFSQQSLTHRHNRAVTPMLCLIIFLISLSGTLYMGFVRVSIATDLTTETKGQQIKSIFQLDPSKVSSKQELWTGGRLETNAEISRLLKFQDAQQAEHQEQDVLVNLKYFYDPIACIHNVLRKEKYVCIAFEEYIQLVMPTLPADIRRKLVVKSVNDLSTSEWLSVAYNRDFPWAHEMTMFVLRIVESGIFDFWIRNLSSAIPTADQNGEGGIYENGGGEGDRQDFDSYAVQHEGLEALGKNFGMGVVLIVIAFLVEFSGFILIKIMRERRVLGKMRNGLGRIYHRIMDRLRGITPLNFVP